MTNYEKYPHYFKPIPKKATHIDVYAVLQMFEVTDQAIGHAIKKLLVPGARGIKSQQQDVKEAIDTLLRWQALQLEMQPSSASDYTEQLVSINTKSSSTVRHVPDFNVSALHNHHHLGPNPTPSHCTFTNGLCLKDCNENTCICN
jgi:hypothetical protein